MKTNYFISPLITPDHILKNYPHKIRICAGSEDPLVDQSWEFLRKLKNLKKDVFLTIFLGFHHGVMNFDSTVVDEVMVKF